MDYVVVAGIIATLVALYLHWWFFSRIRRWVDRDLALNIAGSDPKKREYMLKMLEQAKQHKVKKAELQTWLEEAAKNYTEQ